MNGKIKLNKQQEQNFLNELVSVLKQSDLSRLDLKTTAGRHRLHNAIIENYEISIIRTPVYVVPSGLRGILCGGKWLFEPNKYERYELCISENEYDVRLNVFEQNHGNRYVSHNIVMHVGTMATDAGSYYPKHRDVMLDNFEDLCTNQNSHLFNGARDLYDVFDAEYVRRIQNIKSHILTNPTNNNDMQVMRMRLLNACRRNLVETK